MRSRSSCVSELGATENVSFASHVSIARPMGVGTTLETMAATAAFSHHSTHPYDEDTEAASAVETLDVPTLSLVKKFILTGYPLTISSLAQFSFNTVIIAIIGQFLGVEELGGASLALGMINATGFAFGAGLCGALETVLSHTYGQYGAKDDEQEVEMASVAVDESTPNTQRRDTPSGEAKPLHMYGVYAQRMAVILFVVAFPLGIILSFMDYVLQVLGEDPAVLYFTGVWCRYSVFGIPAALAYQLIQRYYSCQCVTKPLSIAMISAALVNAGLQIGFVKWLGFVGSPIAWVLLMIGIVASLVSYMRFTGLYKRTWNGWNEKSVQNIGGLLGLAIPSMGVMLSEWVALEVNALAAGFGTANELAAFSITVQVFTLMWGVTSGAIILACVFVGNAVGSGRPLLARRIAFIAIGIVFSIAVTNVIVFFILDPYVPYLFTKEPEVARIYSKLMYFVLPYHVLDTFQSSTMSILRGCQLQKLGAIIITIAFCVVGVPVGFVLFFHFKIGICALWIGPLTGVTLVGIPTYIYILLRGIKWEKIRPHRETLTVVECETSGDEALSHEAADPYTSPRAPSSPQVSFAMDRDGNLLSTDAKEKSATDGVHHQPDKKTNGSTRSASEPKEMNMHHPFD